MRRVAAAAVLAALAAACGGGTASIGPLSLDVPDGWQVTSQEGDNLQLANGSTGGSTGTTAGTAKAVFDVYLDADHTPESYRAYLRKENVGTSSERLRIGGEDAVLLAYQGASVAGRQEAVFIPARRVQIVYRAAYAGDDTAFFAGRAAFRRAIASIRFSAD